MRGRKEERRERGGEERKERREGRRGLRDAGEGRAMDAKSIHHMRVKEAMRQGKGNTPSIEQKP